MANPEDLGRYRLRRLLGRGVLGEVWEANDVVQEGAKVCVKIMHAADEELAFARIEFAREARLAALVRHPNLVAVHDSGEAAGTSFLVMDMVEGTSLQKVLSAPSHHRTAEKLRWVREIGAALSTLHAAGLAHKDVKAENVILRPDGSACLVDLGIAKWWKSDEPPNPDAIEALPSSTGEASIYVPPETSETSVYDELGDQYAWGVLARELLSGDEDVPENVAATIARAHAMKREDRWDTMEIALEAMIVTPRVRARTTPLPPLSEASADPRRPLLIVIGVGVVLLLIIVAVFSR
jgi:eukaryotic-like serine/threonine-protein kinase